MRDREQVEGVIDAAEFFLSKSELEEIELAWTHELATRS